MAEPSKNRKVKQRMVFGRKLQTIRMKGLALAGAVLAVELIVMLCAGLIIRHADQLTDDERKASEIVTQINRLMLEGRKAYVTAMETFYTQPNPSDRGDMEGELKKLKELTRNDPSIAKSVSEIESSYREAGPLVSKAKALAEMKDPRSWQVYIQINELTNISNRQLSVLLNECEKARQKQFEESAATRQTLNYILIAFAVLNGFVVVGMVIGFSNHVSNRVATLKENSVRFSTGQELLPTEKTNDEISDLDRAMHDMAGILQDATRRERAVLENASDLICSLTSEGKFASSNRAAVSVLGYTPDELLGKRYVDLIAEEDKEATVAKIDEVITDKSSTQIENRMIRKDRSMIDAAWSMQWSDEDKALSCVIHDVTQRKEVERLKRSFLEMVSHDLRSPLTSIQASVEMVASGAYGEFPDKSKNVLKQVTGNIGRLVALVNGLLSLEKMESGNMQLNCSTISASAVVTPSIHSLQGLAQKRRIEIAEVNENNPRFFADEDRLVQVLVNLLSNAIKFSPDKTKVTVVVEEGLDYVEIQVNDQGPGIPKDQRERVFERFKQVDPSDETKKGGIGLGLPICKAIVEQHGGTIGAGTADGGGCKMWFRLPKPNSAID